MEMYLNNVTFEQRPEERGNCSLGITSERNTPSRGKSKPPDARACLALAKSSEAASVASWESKDAEDW